MKLSSRRFKIIGFGVLLVALAVGALTVLDQRGGEPTPAAMAAMDSTSVGDGENDKKEGKKKGGDKDGEDEEKEVPPVPVEIITAEARSIPSYFHSTGSLEANRQVDLISKSGGQVVKLRVEEGDYVERGHVLLEIDHREDDLLVEQAEVRAETATRESDRIREMVERGLGSEKDLEAKKELSDIAVLERDLAKVRRNNKIVRAPFRGQVTQRHIELGQTVNVGQTLLGFADVSPLEVRLFLPEKIVRRLETGQPVEIHSDVNVETPLTGRVSRIAPAVDPATSTVKVTLEVDDAPDGVRVGSFVRARITTDVHDDAVSVPKKALVPEAGVTYVFVAEDDSVRKVAVTTGYTDDEFIEITLGIEGGERIVSVGQGGLRQGSKIRDLAAEPTDEEVADASAGGDSAADRAN